MNLLSLYSFIMKFRRFIESFASTLHPQKNQWVTIGADIIEQDPSIANELFQLIDTAYKNIGGHVDFRSPQDVINAFQDGQISLLKAIDVDEHPDPDAVTISKPSGGGHKGVAMAAKPGVRNAITQLLGLKKQALHTPNHYAEVSDAAAKVLLGMGVPVVLDKNMVQKVLHGKQIVWYGQHPDLENLKPSVQAVFGKYNGWYGRVLGDGKVHAKIMVGLPPQLEDRFKNTQVS